MQNGLVTHVCRNQIGVEGHGGRSPSFGSHVMKDVLTLSKDELEEPHEAVYGPSVATQWRIHGPGRRMREGSGYDMNRAPIGLAYNESIV